VTDIMAEISAASVEQSSGIEQVNQAVTQMDEVTQQNAALVEEAAAAAEALQEQSEGLAQAVSVFRLDTGSAVAAAKRPAVHEEPQAEKAEEGQLKAKHAGKVVPHPASHAKQPAPRAARSGGKMLAHKPAEDAEEWSEF
jgi:methyl-accepting chemotaxis protein